MLEGKALVVAIMMLTAAPLVVTDDGRAIVGDVTNEVADLFIEEEKIAEDPNLNEVLDDAMGDCLTLEEWKRSDVTSKENYVKDEVERKDSESKKEESKKDDGSRNEDNKEEDCITEAEYNQILESSEFSSTEGKEEEKPCYFLADIKEKMMKDKEGKDWDREDWNKEDKDWEKEDWDIVIEELAGACEEGDEESCEKLELLREKLAEDREEDEANEEEQEDDGSRSGDDGCNSPDCESDEESEDEADDTEEDDGEHSHTDDKADDHSHDDDKADDHNHVTDRYDENWEEIRAAIEELKVACEEGNEEACLELREMIAEMMEDHKGDWDREGKGWDEACLTMDEWKKVFDNDRKEKGYGHKNNHKEMNIERFLHMFEELDEEEISEIKQIIGMSDEEWDSMVLKLETKNMTKDDWKIVMEKMKILFEHKMKEDREEMEAFRVQMTELGEACEAGDEDSCEELELLMEELENDFREDREGECDEHDNEEEDESEEEQTDEDESEE